MLHVAPLSQDTLPKSPDTKRFANRSKTSFSPGRQNILLFIGLAEETRLLPALCLGWYFRQEGELNPDFYSLAMPDMNDCHRLHSVGWILPVPLVVAFAPASEYHFHDFDEHPQSQYCNDYVSHITDLFLITTCKDTKKLRHGRIYNVKYQCNMWLFRFLPIRFELGLQETYNFRKSQFLLEFEFLDKQVPSCV